MKAQFFALMFLALACNVNGKSVFAHFMIGNTYGYTQAKFQADITAAQAAGIDAFALNVGSDSWTWQRVDWAYAAAQAVGSSFKLFISFDMSFFSNGTLITSKIRAYASHPNQFKYSNKAFVSTFAGDFVNLGQSSANAGWQKIKNDLGNTIYFVPNWSSQDANTVFANNPVVDGIFSWAAWTDRTHLLSQIITQYDGTYMSRRPSGKTYMAPLSPWFYTHLSYKNYLYICEFLWLDRWQQLATLGSDFVEIITWNDWGESHYIGTIDTVAGDLPTGSAAYVNGFDHTAWQAVLPYFISAYKNYPTKPTISSDIVIFWYRPHFKASTASSDPYGRPAVETINVQPDSGITPASVLADNIFIVALAMASGTITVNSGSSAAQNFAVTAGVNRITAPFSAGVQKVTLFRNNAQVITGTGSVQVTSTPSSYNYNVIVVRLR